MTEIIQHKENTQIAFSGIGTWEYILETNELLFDNQWLNLIGGSNEEVVFHKDFWEDRIHPDDKSLVLETFERFIKNRSNAYKIEYRLRNKKGDYVTVLDLGTVIQRDELSYARHVKICTIDVTAKVLANREKSDEKYRSIFDHLNDAFCEFDFYGNILDFNQNLCNLLEVSESELKETNLQLFFSDKTVKYLYKDLTNIVTNEKVNFETTIVSKRNNLIPVSVNSRLITVAGNGVVQALIRDITERKAFEKALFEEKQRYQALVEHSPMVITRFGKNLRCQYASPNIFEMLGIYHEICIGKRFLEMNFSFSLSKYLEEKIKWVIKKNKVLKINFSLDTLSGVKHFDAILVPEPNPNTGVDSVLITYTDITEKINGERELSYSKQQLEEFEKSVHFGTYEIDLLTGSSKWSKEAYLIYDRDPSGVPPSLEELFYNYLHPDDYIMVTESINECALNARNVNITYRIITLNGTVKFINDVIRAELNRELSKPVKLHGTIIDVTEKKIIENRLITEHDILQVIMDNVPDAIYLKNIQGQFIRANKALSDLLLLRGPEELIGKNSYDFFPKEVADEITEVEQNIYLTGIPAINQENEFQFPSGKVWLSSTTVGVKDCNGKVTQIVGISRNINQYKTTQEQLQKEKERAEVADKLKSAFLANMSHEIRTPINGILGFANLLENREFPRDKQIRYLRIINNSGKLLLNLINDIIDIAKIEAGQITIEISKVNLFDLIHEIYEFYIGEKKRREKELVDIIIDAPEDSYSEMIITDPFRLKQIINNLISNSIKFTEKGQIVIGYRIEIDQVLFFVRDSGIGMSQDEAAMIFERFKQAGISSRKKEGTGLGLAISKGLVELLGGKIWVSSKLGKGSAFYFSIPVKQFADNHVNELNQQGLGYETEYNWTGKYMLLVEDEEVNYLYINELLVETGINLIHTTTAEEAIVICRSTQPIDVVLMDMRLPGINGLEATRIVKQIRTGLPVIAQTAYAMENERKDCLEAGCDHYLTKPFDQDGLFKVINNYI